MIEDNLNQNDKRLYISFEAYQAADWLDNHTDSESVILADYNNGNVIPALAGRRVYLGHWSQTSDFDYKKELIESWFFYTNDDDKQKRVFIFESNIDYIFFSKSEDGLGKYSPVDKDYLKAIYSNNAVTIYRVIK